jgi:BirA family biotin operon repressor/biotin-[acetyl-CoA-carboxylase] ligase
MGIFVFNPIERELGNDIQSRPDVERLKRRRDLPRSVTVLRDDLAATLAPLTSLDGPLRHVEVRDTIGSTNAEALEDGREGLVLVALEQTEGRGRHGNTWSSPRGGLYLSYVPPLAMIPQRPTDLSLVASLAVATSVDKTLEDAGVREPRALLKWPNDVLVGDGKVAGVLVQSREPPMAVVGVGLNVNALPDLLEERAPEEWPVGPMALCQVAGRPLDLRVLAPTLVSELSRRVREGLDASAFEEYRRRCHTLGRRVTFSEGERRVEGTAVDVDPEGGGLLVRVEGGQVRRVTSGMVHHVRSEKG